MFGVLGQGQKLSEVMAQPPLLSAIDLGGEVTLPGQGSIMVPKGRYDEAFLAKLNAAGLNVAEIDPAVAQGLRGTVTAVEIDAKTGRREAANQSGVSVFNAAQ